MNVSGGYVKAALKREAGYVTEIEHLRAWIRQTGEQVDICTRNILGEVCSNCRCGKAKPSPDFPQT